MSVFKRIFLIMKRKQKKNIIAPVLFNNTPISDIKDDIFGFKEQVNILDSAIKNGLTLIGIIGDYGSGKSSLAEISQKKLRPKYGQALRINMWDTIRQDDRGHDFSFLIRSFLYQLAQGNKKENANFARYINERQSKNYGKISLTMASRLALVCFILAGLFFIIYLTLENTDILNFILNILRENKFYFLLKAVNLLRISTYLILFISLLFVYIGISKGSFVFSLWDSQGKMNPEYGDILDNYIHIMNRITSFSIFRKKKIIYIEDLDRIDEKQFVIPFLKELHRFINLLPNKQKRKIAFIVSLKSESSLKKELQNNILEGDKSVYSKIFDYTLWIKPIHYENISDAVWVLLCQNQESIKKILSLNKNDELTKTLLNELYWIQKGENLTIREIKDRLNEAFILYQTLKARDFENSSVKLNKCCAVAYLHRAYPSEYEILLMHEQKMAELIRDCCQWQNSNKDSITKEVTEIIGELFSDTSLFIEDFTKMIFNVDIDEDFMMYFYNYPTSSYIKNLNEKEILDYILHPSDKYKSDKQIIEKINHVITQKKGKVINEAIDEIKGKKQYIPDIVFEYEQLFSFVLKNNSDIIISTLVIFSVKIIENPSKICNLLRMILFYNIDEKQKEKIIKSIIYGLFITMKGHDIEKISLSRIHLIKSVKSYIIYFNHLFVDEEMPIITIQELQSLNSPDEKLSLINYKLIDKNNYNYIFKEINNLELNDNQYIKAENIFSNITNIELLPNVYKHLLVFLSKNKKYNNQFLSVIVDNMDDSDKPVFCDYLNTIDISLLTEEQLNKLDEMKLKNISDEKIILFLEEKKLYQSALLSRVTLGIIDNFDFLKADLFSDVPDYFKDVYKEFPEEYLAIRFAVFKQLHDKPIKLYKLFLSGFPLISDYEIDLIDDIQNELYMYIDHSLVNINNYEIITEYCNKKNLCGDKLYDFFVSLFFNENDKISDVDCIKSIFSGIDFRNTIHFETMTLEQQKTICDNLSSIYKLTTAEGSIEFMKIVNCLIPELEKTIANNLDSNEIKYSDYLDLINDVKKPTEETLEIIRNKPLDQALDSVITDGLYKKGYYIRYLIAKFFRDSIIPIDEKIPIEKYYGAFISSDKFAEYCSKDDNILNKFVENKLLNEKLSDRKLIYFYKIRQPLFLLEFILMRLQSSVEETKKYLYSITDIDTEKDADEFIDLITSEKYIELLRDRNLFYFLYHKMWDKKMKQKLTFITNRQLKIEPKYSSREAGDYDEDNSTLDENKEQPEQDQTS